MLGILATEPIRPRATEPGEGGPQRTVYRIVDGVLAETPPPPAHRAKRNP